MTRKPEQHMEQLNVRIPERLARLIRLYAADQRLHNRDVVCAALEAYFSDKKIPAIKA